MAGCGSPRPRPTAGTSGLTTSTAEGHRVESDDIAGELEHVLISEDEIRARLAVLAAQIDADYSGRDLLLVGVLKGAVMVMADLARSLARSADMDWMAVSSYGSGTTSSGVVRILKDLDADITGRNVLVVEDILDSGLTLSWLLKNLSSRGTASVEVFTLLRKPDPQRVRRRIRPGLRGALPQPAVRRDPRSPCVRGLTPVR
jgi:hypoxanthine phosphoribosyltransferase